MEPSTSGASESALPADLQIRWGSGATHAEWGRKEGTLNAQGELVWVESRGYGEDAMREESKGQATKEQMAALWRAIEDNRFFRLDEQYADTDIRDGYSKFIAITADGKTHSVAVMNTSQPQFSRVMDALNELRVSMVSETSAEKP